MTGFNIKKGMAGKWCMTRGVIRSLYRDKVIELYLVDPTASMKSISEEFNIPRTLIKEFLIEENIPIHIGRARTAEEIDKTSGRNHRMFGKHHTSEARSKISSALVGRPAKGPPKGRVPWNKGLIGEKSHNWRGGVRWEYTGFPESLRDEIRERDGWVCRICRIKQIDLRRKLDIHHIDNNPKNPDKENLIALCHKCNCKVSRRSDRGFWSIILRQDLIDREIILLKEE